VNARGVDDDSQVSYVVNEYGDAERTHSQFSLPAARGFYTYVDNEVISSLLSVSTVLAAAAIM